MEYSCTTPIYFDQYRREKPYQNRKFRLDRILRVVAARSPFGVAWAGGRRHGRRYGRLAGGTAALTHTQSHCRGGGSPLVAAPGTSGRQCCSQRCRDGCGRDGRAIAAAVTPTTRKGRASRSCARAAGGGGGRAWTSRTSMGCALSCPFSCHSRASSAHPGADAAPLPPLPLPIQHHRHSTVAAAARSVANDHEPCRRSR